MAMDFDGVDDYTDVGADLSPFMGATASISVWMNTTQSGSGSIWTWPGVTGVEQAGGTNDIFWATIAPGGQIGGNTGNGPHAQTAVAANDGAWHHIVITRDSTTGTMTVYLDGVFSGSATSPSGAKTTAFQSIGRCEDTGASPEEYDGLLDDVRLYDRELTAAEVATIYASRGTDGIVDGLRDRYLLNEQSPGTAAGGAGQQKDTGPDQNNGTPNSAPTYETGVLRYRRKVA